MSEGALAGVRVLELGQLVAAPVAGQILADLGAEVVKVERPGRGDEYRHYGPSFVRDANGDRTDISAAFLAANINKRSIAIDFTKPEGHALVLGLASKADVVIENFRAGTLDAHGLGRSDMSAINPELIYVSISGFGRTGAAARLPGTDSVFQAISGLMSITGDPSGLPQKVGASVVDYVTALYATIGVLAALHHRGKGNGGQALDVSLLDCSLALMSMRSAEYFVEGAVPQRYGHRTAGAAPAQLFRCSDGYINVQAGFDHHFRTLCELLGLPGLADDPRYLTRELRVVNMDSLEVELQAVFNQRSVVEWYDLLREAELICAPIFDVEQCYANPFVAERGLRRTFENSPMGPVDFVANPLRFEATPIDHYTFPPHHGEHNGQVLSDWLGHDDSMTEALRAKGVFG